MKILLSVLTMHIATLIGITAAYPACTNANLLAETKTTDPATYDVLRAEADAVPNGQGIFWRIDGPQMTAPSYLFGTLHKADPRITKLPRNLVAALESTDTLAVELVSLRNPLSATAAMVMKPHLFVQPKGLTLSQRLSPETVATLTEILAAQGIAFSNINHLQPWLAIGFLAFSSCDLAHGGIKNPVLDEVITAKARDLGKTIVGLETTRGQLEALASVGSDAFLRMLDDTAAVHRAGKLDPLLQTVTELYLQEDIADLFVLSAHLSTDSPQAADDYAALERQLLDVRNVGMVEKSAELIAAGPTFIAVGAGHLMGDTGLVAGLRAKGYAVTRLPLER